MTCSHPLAARQIVVIDGKLVTRCWACAVEAEPTSKPGWPAKIRLERGTEVR